MRITYSESRVKLGRSGKGLITSLGLNAITSPNKYKKTRYAIEDFSKKYIQRLLGILKDYLMKVMRRRGPNIILLVVTFTKQENL